MAPKAIVRDRNLTCHEHHQIVASREVKGQDVSKLMVRAGPAVDFR